MQNNENQIMKLNITDHTEGLQKAHQNPELIFLLEGKAEIEVRNVQMIFHAEDFLVINSGEEHAISMTKSGLLGQIIMDYTILNNYTNLYENEFKCNSIVDKDENAHKLQRLLRQIFSDYYKQDGMESILLNATFYELLYHLCMHFMVKKQNIERKIYSDDTQRFNRILDYIQNNYNQTITLSDLADQTYFSTAYLSKYIKRKIGKTFMEYLTDIRLMHALQDIEHTEKTFMKVALDNGFPNTVAFNKAFKKNYFVTPSEYQKNLRQKRKENITDLQNNEQLSEKIRDFLHDYSKKYASKCVETYLLEVNMEEARPLKQYWNRMINGGLAKDLLRADMQQHILLLKEELHFEYVRFWDIYAPEMFLHQEKSGEQYNFSKMDTIFDFLINHGLKPYVELGFKPIRLLKNLDDFMVSEEREIIFKTTADYAEFLNQYLKHCVNRYGMEEVEAWYFEQWKDPRYKDLDVYFRVFETAYSVIKSFSPNIKIGGAGLNRDEGYLFTEIMEQWRNRNCYPDFISLYSYPYNQNQVNHNAYNSYYSRNQNYMLNYADMAREVLHKNGFWNQELHISEWNFTVSNRSCLNDSVFKGAYVVKNLLDVYGKADIVGYWFGSDLFSEYYDTNRLLDGSGGLISKDGIRKPAFYGISFLNRLGTYLLGKNNNSIITTNLHDTYSILCHHYEHPNYKYFMKEENNIRISEISEFFDNDTVKMSFTINGVKNGFYSIKTRTVSEENGSILDEWVRMGLSDNLNSQDIDYLERICIPRITIKTSSISDNCIHLETILHTNEFKHIHIYYQL